MRVVATVNDHEADAKAGDVICVLHYQGEGYWEIWHYRKLVDMEGVLEKEPFPKTAWWVQIKTAFGVVGWALPPHFRQSGSLELTPIRTA